MKTKTEKHVVTWTAEKKHYNMLLELMKRYERHSRTDMIRFLVVQEYKKNFKSKDLKKVTAKGNDK